MKYSANISAIIISLLLFGCSDLTDYSPDDTDVDSQGKNINEAEKITGNSDLHSDTLKFALFSDTHENYDDLADAIKSINARSDLQFAVSCGDITRSGLAQEYQWYLRTAGRISHPLITAIGNHDNLVNGLNMYKKLFGDPNLSFICGKYKFIVFGCTMTENYDGSPKYKWLKGELTDSIHIKVFISHFAPYTGDIDYLNRLVLNNILKSGDVKLCLHGHFHSYNDLYYNGIHTIIADRIKSREYYIIKLTGDKSFVETIKF